MTNATSRLIDDLEAVGLPALANVVLSSAELEIAKPDPAASCGCTRNLGDDKVGGRRQVGDEPLVCSASQVLTVKIGKGLYF